MNSFYIIPSLIGILVGLLSGLCGIYVYDFEKREMNWFNFFVVSFIALATNEIVLNFLQ